MNKLIDNFGREISYLRVSITDRCNYRCVYCQSKKEFEFIPHQEILRFEEIVEIVQEAVNLGITKVRITGGEPLVREGIVDFIRQLRKVNKLKDISLTTNGFFLPEYAEKLKDAGLNRVNISLDSLQEEKYKKITRGGSLEKAGFVRLALERPLNIRFIEFMPSGEEVINEFENKFISVLEIKEKLIKKYLLNPIKISIANGPAKYYQIKGGQGTIGFITALSQHFCKTCNRIRLTSEGKLRPCLFSNKEIDIKQAIRNAKTDDKIIRSKIIRNNIEKAVSIKPEGHKLNEKFSNRDFFKMSKIGG
jgi:cyclic pyranopterin phosphate synthase